MTIIAALAVLIALAEFVSGAWLLIYEVSGQAIIDQRLKEVTQ